MGSKWVNKVNQVYLRSKCLIGRAEVGKDVKCTEGKCT